MERKIVQMKEGYNFMNNTCKLSIIEATSLILIVVISHIILDLPNVLLVSASSAAPLNIIYITVLALMFFLIINKLFTHFSGKDIIDVSEFIGGPLLKKIVSLLYSLQLIFIAGILILNFSQTIRTIYLQDMPNWLICLVFILIGIISNLFGFKNVSKINSILMPFILITIIAIFIALFTDFVPERIFPILGYGINETFFLGSTNIFALGGIILLFLIRPQLKDDKAAKKVGIFAILISGVFLLLTVTVLLFIFPFTTGREGVLSVYMITRTIQFGKFFQRVDALFILIWVLTFFSYLAVIMSYVVKITNKNYTPKHNTITVYLTGASIFLVSLIPKDIVQIRFAQNVIYKYSTLIIVFGLTLTIMILGYLKKKKQKRLCSITTENVLKENSDES